MSKLYEKLGSDPMTLIMKGVPNSSVLICYHSNYSSLLAIKHTGQAPFDILPEFVDINMKILDTRLTPDFGWVRSRTRSSISDIMYTDLSGYACWAFCAEEYSYEQVFKTIKEVYDRNTSRYYRTIQCPEMAPI